MPNVNALPNILLEITNESNEILNQSESFSVNDNHIYKDLEIKNNKEINLNDYFQCESDFLTKLLEDATSLERTSFNTITLDEPNSEVQTLSIICNLRHEEIQNMIFTSTVLNSLNSISDGGIPFEYIYVIIKKYGLSEWSSTQLELQDLEDLITAAIQNLIIPEIESHSIEDAYQLFVLAKTMSYSQSKSEDGDSLSTLLNIFLNNTEDVLKFIQLSELHSEKSISDFWQIIENEFGISQTIALQNGLQLLAITGMQPEMTISLFHTLDGSAPAAVLSLWDFQNWKIFIDNVCTNYQKLCIPQSIRGNQTSEEDEESKTKYAFHLYLITTGLFVNQVLIARLNSDLDFANQFSNPLAVSNFLLEHPDYDFRTENVWTSELFLGNSSLQNDLIPLQNLIQLTNGIPDLVVVLLKNNIKSSAEFLSFIGNETLRNNFLRNLIPSDVRESINSILFQIYQKAIKNEALLKEAYVQMLPGSYVEKISLNWNAHIWQDKNKIDTSIPDFATLFGSADFCNCAHCNSMYSLTAYYTDILNFIQTKINQTEAYTELIRRRPDLPYIDLSCKNANTLLPYIDLVIEQLELLILKDPNQDQHPPLSFQTEATSEELAAYPEHMYKTSLGEPYVNYNHYTFVYNERLQQAFYPNTLPFHLPLVESRTYWRELKKRRYDLMLNYRSQNFNDTNSTAPIQSYSAWAEWLELSIQEADIISKENQTVPIPTEAFYGFPSGIWYETLCLDLKGLLQRTQIDYITLLQLLTTDFLNPVDVNNQQRVFAIVAQPGFPVDTCVLDELMLQCGLQPAADYQLSFFDKLHRFIRLLRATQWTVRDLDIICSSFNILDIDKISFMLIAQVHYHCKTLRILPEHITAMWQLINTQKYINFLSQEQNLMPSVYETLFQNKAVSNPTDSHFADPLNITGDYIENAGTLIATLGISEEDLETLLNFLNISPSSNIQIGFLSKMYGIKLLAKSKNYSVQILLRIFSLLQFEINPLQNPIAQFQQWTTVIDALLHFDNYIFSLDELEYLFANKTTSSQLIPSVTEIQYFYENLRANLLAINRDLEWLNNERPEPLDLLTKQLFSQLFQIDLDCTNIILNHYVTNQNELLINLIISPEFINSSEAILPTSGIPLLDFNDLYIFYYQLKKISLLLDRLAINDLELECLQKLQTSLAIAPLFNMPVEPVVNIQTRPFIMALQYLLGWIQVRDKYALGKDSFCTLLYYSTGATEDSTPITKQDWSNYTISLFHWNADALTFLIGDNTQGGILETIYSSITADNHFKRGAFTAQIAEIFLLEKETGLSVQKTYDAIVPNLNMTHSQVVRKAAKAQYDSSYWQKIAPSLQDKLRKKQRNALVDFIIAHPELLPNNQMHIKTKDDLYAYLLIDPQMETCMQTSRLRLAVSTVQLFMDRILLNIEKSNGGNLITLSDIYSKQWQSWRKWYRVWEANRKIFFYPENWIEPELRDDKSKLFKDLEMQLMQQELSDSAATEAVHLYLDGMEAVSNLEPVSVYKDPHSNRYHFFAKNDSEPQIYYYRTLEAEVWSAWEKVEIDIKGSHLTPLMWNGRLYLFWLSFLKKKPNTEEQNQLIAQNQASTFNNKKWIQKITQPASDLVDDQYSNNRFTTWEIRLHWSQHLNGQWTASSFSKDVMEIDISKILLNNYAIQSFSDTNKAKAIWQLLAKGNEISLDDVFKNRLYLLASFESNNEADGINFNLLFPGGWDENAIGLHTFLWKGDNSKEPYVLRNSDRGHQLLAPFGSYFNQMKLVGNKEGQALYKDGYHTVYDGYYAYSIQTYFDNMPRRNRLGSLKILANTPKGIYKVTAKAKNQAVVEDNPMQEMFFFEDDYHKYFVHNYPLQKYVFTQAIQNNQQINISALSQFVNLYYPKFIANNHNPSQSPLLSGTITNSIPGSIFTNNRYRFQTFYHPQIRHFKQLAWNKGMDGLMQLENQNQLDTMHFQQTYQPSSLVHPLYPRNNVQFDLSEPYAHYNWELFFHIPMFIANQFSNNLKFEEARKWYHYIFNPTSNVGLGGATITDNRRFWKFYPFYEQAGQSAQTLSDLMIAIHQNINSAVTQVQQSENHPFQPYVIARMRTWAFMKNVLMKYLDNLIAWADHLFKMDTMESINEASQLYILAAQILGERPQEIPARVKKNIHNFIELTANGPLDMLSNAMVAIESFFAPNAGPDFYSWSSPSSSHTPDPTDKINLQTFYFCLPKNEKLLGYWDTIADRLFKIRNCMNIDGLERILALYEPPIDPAFLVRANAMGIDIQTALASIQAQKPHYRFQYILQKANELTADVRNLGASLLQILEKKDAEALALLRSGQEGQLLSYIRNIKEMQIHDNENALAVLQRAKESVQVRLEYYASRTFINTQEAEHMSAITKTTALQSTQAKIQLTGSAMAMLPQLHGQIPFSVGPSFGGQHLSAAMNAISAGIGVGIAKENHKAQIASLMGGYIRRKEEWELQAELAQKELIQLDTQILGTQIKLEMARKELANHDLQIEHSQETDQFMRDKYTNEQLYQWMIAQISATYFQSYYLARNLAVKAVECFAFELPTISTSGFIGNHYWDNLKKGLLSGEQLQFDLRKMEATYIDENKRELELTKHISLAAFNPQALVALQEKGWTNFDIPEMLYDLDHPGHYLRRIKSVALTFPNISGPYTNISASLRMTNNMIRKDTTLLNNQYKRQNDDPRFIQAQFLDALIATSSGMNDNGLFELNFKDERYLPFEGAGAISSWSLSLPNTDNDDPAIQSFRQFDYQSITDVIMTIQYTAKIGGKTLEKAAQKNIEENINNILDELESSEEGLWQLISFKKQFTTEFFTLLEKSDNGIHSLEVSLDNQDYPYIFSDKALNTQNVLLLLIPKKGKVEYMHTGVMQLSYKNINWELFGTGTATDMNPIWGNLASINFQRNPPVMAKGKWKLEIDENLLGNIQINGIQLYDPVTHIFHSELIEDIVFVINYKKA